MDAFEALVAMLLRHDGYWVTQSFKVNLTKEDKQKIGTATMPRLELDLIAYKGATNELLVVECKSFLDSTGVRYRGFDGTSTRFAKRYKLFNSGTMRKIVFQRLEEQLSKAGTCADAPTIQLALAAGKIASASDRADLHKHFEKRGWKLFDEDWLQTQLKLAAKHSYENDIAFVVSKLLLRKKKK